ncbi:MAG: CocE/NonD family hydrolase [Rhizobiaceae bacterium]|nr:CocE/NonD family hydrolase [Rhizobiaceae bacterium]
MDFGGVAVEYDVPVPMRDGTILRADIYSPSDREGLPVLLQRTPYNKRFAQSGVYLHPAWYARRGYIVAVQDVRGRFASDGVFEPYRHEASDGADTVVWASGLGGGSRVAMYGFSYAGMCQLAAASERPPGLAALAVAMAGSDFYEGWTYRGGAFQLAFVLSWVLQALAPADAMKAGDAARARRLQQLASTLPHGYGRPLKDWLAEEDLPSYLRDWIANDEPTAYWRELAPWLGKVPDVPCLHIGGWYDVFIGGTIENYVRAATHSAASADQSLLVGPWQHVPWASFNGSVFHGPAGDNIVNRLQCDWFDRFLRDSAPAEPLPKVRYFRMGRNDWLEDESWPPKQAAMRELFLHSDGAANSVSGDGRLTPAEPSREPPDLFVYDPSEPVPSLGGKSCCRADVAPVGAFDQREIETRNDVLVYSSDPLEEDLDLAGPVELVLFAASDAAETDWTAKLVDVQPNGRAINICDGIVRARAAAEPGEYVIDLGSTANCFRKGHRVRLEVSSSNFPAYDANDNTGLPLAERNRLTGRLATQAIYHDADRPSRLRFSVGRGA